MKAQGNKYLQEGNFNKAIECYSNAIELCPKNHVLFSNRSAAFAKQGKYSEALVDARKTVELNSTWGKVRQFCHLFFYVTIVPYLNIVHIVACM